MGKLSVVELSEMEDDDYRWTPEEVAAQAAAARERRRSQRRGPYSGSVYFLHDVPSVAVKIGVADDVRKRRKLLQTGNPHRLVLIGAIPGGLVLEAQIHAHFAPWRLRGEWFHAAEAVLILIDRILAQGWPLP